MVLDAWRAAEGDWKLIRWAGAEKLSEGGCRFGRLRSGSIELVYRQNASPSSAVEPRSAKFTADDTFWSPRSVEDGQ